MSIQRARRVDKQGPGWNPGGRSRVEGGPPKSGIETTYRDRSSQCPSMDYMLAHGMEDR